MLSFDSGLSRDRISSQFSRLVSNAEQCLTRQCSEAFTGQGVENGSAQNSAMIRLKYVRALRTKVEDLHDKCDELLNFTDGSK